ncbi:hypothetical protein PLAN_50145 [Planktothrix rubescens CCAP 1459/22]|uniref:Uncharacterized protein n=1 Tax=Planktothrix rubescens CCAP 1459/22 TaxID=329571 RepID=A0A6J7ZQL5_PLARU|nr:hypothetical protein PLAN_50145 [Planktothrix rubescens NIVA-CYA 18]
MRASPLNFSKMRLYAVPICTPIAFVLINIANFRERIGFIVTRRLDIGVIISGYIQSSVISYQLSVINLPLLFQFFGFRSNC